MREFRETGTMTMRKGQYGLFQTVILQPMREASSKCLTSFKDFHAGICLWGWWVFRFRNCSSTEPFQLTLIFLLHRLLTSERANSSNKNLSERIKQFFECMWSSNRSRLFQMDAMGQWLHQNWPNLGFGFFFPLTTFCIIVSVVLFLR